MGQDSAVCTIHQSRPDAKYRDRCRRDAGLERWDRTARRTGHGAGSSLGVTGGSAGPSIAQVGCEILDLSLGPIDLDLLGLVVHLDEVNLEIVAVPGAGNLLGNLLCAIAGLLDPQPQLPLIGNLLQQVLNLLNQILGILG